MPTTVAANRTTGAEDVVLRLALQAYLAGLGTAATLVLGAVVIASLGLKAVVG